MTKAHSLPCYFTVCVVVCCAGIALSAAAQSSPTPSPTGASKTPRPSGFQSGRSPTGNTATKPATKNTVNVRPSALPTRQIYGGGFSRPIFRSGLWRRIYPNGFGRIFPSGFPDNLKRSGIGTSSRSDINLLEKREGRIEIPPQPNIVARDNPMRVDARDLLSHPGERGFSPPPAPAADVSAPAAVGDLRIPLPVRAAGAPRGGWRFADPDMSCATCSGGSCGVGDTMYVNPVGRIGETGVLDPRLFETESDDASGDAAGMFEGATLVGEDPEQAETLLREYLGAAPDDLEAQRLFAIALLGNRKLEQGITAMRLAYRLDPGLASRPIDPAALGLTNARLRALVALVVSHANRTGDPAAWFAVAILMQAQGRDELALSMIHRAEQAGLDWSTLGPLAAELGTERNESGSDNIRVGTSRQRDTEGR